MALEGLGTFCSTQNKMSTDFLEDNDGKKIPLKALYTFGNCHRSMFSLGVSHHKHNITSLYKFGLIGHQSCEKIIKEKTPLLEEFVCFQIGKKDF